MIKNIIILRKISNIFYFLMFILSIFALFFIDDKTVSIFGINFCFNKINTLILFLCNFVMYLSNLNSKSIITYKEKIFYPLSFIMLLMTNLIILTNNILISYCALFIVFLINYIIHKSRKYFSIDCLTLFSSFVLLSYGLLRYFVVNNIQFTLSNIELYQNRIDSLVISIAFFGFLIVIFRLFNFIPFNTKFKNSHIQGFNTVLYLTIGCILLIKTFILFNYYFFKFQSLIAIYLIVNILYFVLMQFRVKGIIEFLNYTLPINITIGIFALFLYSESGLISFIYYSLGLILTYSAGFFISDIIERKMGSNIFISLKKISHNDRLIRFFIFIIFLNIAKIPPFVSFFAGMYSILNIFLIDFAGKIMTFVPYILFFCLFALSLNSFSVLYKILIEPVKPMASFLLSQRQKTVLLIICFAIFISGVGVEYILNQFTNFIDVGG